MIQSIAGTIAAASTLPKLPTKAIAEIQKAGTAISAAQALLKGAIAEAAQKASTAMLSGKDVLTASALTGQWSALTAFAEVLDSTERDLVAIYRTAAAHTSTAPVDSTGSPLVAQGAAPVPAPARATSRSDSLMPASGKLKKAAKKAALVKKLKASPLASPVVASVVASAATSPAAPGISLAPVAPGAPAESAPAVDGVKPKLVKVTQRAKLLKPVKAVKLAKPTKAPKAPKAPKVPKVPKAPKTPKAARFTPGAEGQGGDSLIAKILARSKTRRRPTLKGNPAKLMTALSTTLSTQSFAPINQTEIAKSTGIAPGSINAALRKVVSSGAVLAGEGGYKLVP